ncbi:MAG: hypothetical protein K2Q14_00200 [Gammaproteobacteria bacterium]|nr:hypothetical protein [Gammaproteobacteria bacterium]
MLKKDIRIIGDGGTGTSSLVLRYADAFYSDQLRHRSSYKIRTPSINNQDIQLTIHNINDKGQPTTRFWLAGEEISTFIQPADAIMLVVDLSDKNIDFASYIAERVKRIREINKNAPIILIGTKCDLIDERQENDTKTLQALCYEHLLDGFLPVSSRDNTNIDEAFELAAKLSLNGTNSYTANNKIEGIRSVRLADKVMRHAVFLDVDDTLLITQFNKDGSRTRFINQDLLNQLKLSGHHDLYLFTNMDLNDLNQIDEPSRITRKKLIDELIKQGFTVHGVITPADPVFNQGPGAAYNSLYLPAYEKKLKNQSYHKETQEFDRCKNELVVENEYAGKQRDAGQKRAMFNYFLEHKPAGLVNILYFDDATHCLEAVSALAQPSSINVTTCAVDQNRLSALATSSDKQQELELYSKTIENFNPRSRKIMISNVVSIYEKNIALTPWHIKLFLPHGNAGIVKAKEFLTGLQGIEGKKAIDGKILAFLHNDENNGNKLPLSFRTMLLTALLGRTIEIENLKDVSANFDQLLKSYEDSLSKVSVSALVETITI